MINMQNIMFPHDFWNDVLAKRRRLTVISYTILIIVNVVLLVYPIWFFVDFINLKISISNSIISHGEKIIDLEIKALPSEYKNFKLPDQYRNHFVNVNLTLPCESIMMLFLFQANSSIDALIFRHYEMFEAYMNLSSPIHLLVHRESR